MNSPAVEYMFSHLVPKSERKGIIERAKARAFAKVEEREHLRLEIDARECILDMIAIRKTMIAGYEPDFRNPDVLIPLNSTRNTSLKIALEAAEKLLRKVLPDLKSIEIEGDTDADGKYVFNVNTGIIREQDIEEEIVNTIQEENLKVAYPWD